MLPQNIKNYIEENFKLIDSNEFEKFFNDAPSGTGFFLYSADVDFISKLRKIPTYSFAHYTTFDIFVVPDVVEEIGTGAFAECKALKHVYLNDNVLKIGSYAFFNTHIEKIVLPKYLKVIDEGCFRYCTKLIEVNIPEGCEEIGKDAFEYCISLTELHLPHSLKFIGTGAFKKCKNLHTIYFNGTLKEWATIWSKGYYTVTYPYRSIEVVCLDGVIPKKS